MTEFATFPDASLLRWRRLDTPGHERARITRQAEGWVLAGDVEVGSDALGYQIECDGAWRTRRAVVHGAVDGRSVRFVLAADGHGRWSCDGAEARDVDGAIDVDLGFTPATNLLPIRRLALAIGESAAVRSAWIRFPELRLEPLDQTYTREAEHVFRYRAMVDGEPFTARLDVDRHGRVVRYEGLWELERTGRDA